MLIHYRASFFDDGKEFDNSFDKDRKPFEFKVGVNQVCPGLDQGILELKKG